MNEQGALTIRVDVQLPSGRCKAVVLHREHGITLDDATGFAAKFRETWGTGDRLVVTWQPPYVWIS